MKIKGVNLGNWLVLEKWMSQELFEGISAEDETDFYKALDPKEAKLRLHMHRSYFIQERDFQNISAMGLNLVRIPVPHFIFGDYEPGIGCIEYLDRAFVWAEKYNLKILIDLHTAPDSQNGFDNGGLTGIIKWHLKPENIEFELSVLERLAKRYANHKALYGIELLNEPVSPEMWEHVKDRYKPRYPEQAAGSEPIPLEVLKDFYMKGYQAVRKHCPPSVAVVIHDRFCLEQWEDFMPAEEYPGVVIDTHMYLFMLEVKMPDKQLSAYEKMIQKGFKERLERAEKFHPVIVGEWCIANKSSGIKELPENRAFHLSQTFVREWILEEEAAQRDMRASVLRQVLLFVLGFSFSRTVRVMLGKYKMDDTESSTQNRSGERYMRIEAPV